MEQKRLNNRKKQGAKTKLRLLECAEQLFLKKDYTNVSVEDITKAAGVCKGAFYVHYPSKDALIGELIVRNAARCDAEYRAYADGLPPDMPACDRLLALTGKIADVLSDTIGRDNLCKVYQLMLAKDMDMQAVKGYGREVYTLLYETIAQGIERGELRSVLPPEELSRHFITAFRGVVYEWCIRYPELDLKQQAVAVVRLLTEGIKA